MFLQRLHQSSRNFVYHAISANLNGTLQNGLSSVMPTT
jgi:hypothetical protein